MRVVLLAAFAAACGRYNFDPLDDADTPAMRCAAKSIDVGKAHTCAVDSVGQVWCWGRNSSGESVPGVSPQSIATPTQVELPTPAVQIATGASHSCARLDDGSVWCWGLNVAGQLGNGTLVPTSTAGLVQLGGDRAIDLVAGGDHTCIRRELDGAIMCWGDNFTGQCGVTGMTEVTIPMVVAGTAGSKDLGLGHRYSCAVDATDRVQCWGYNVWSQLGTMDSGHTDPMPVAGLGPVERVTAGGSFTCAIEIGGNLRCWGRNENGQLGTTDGMTHFDPQPVFITDAVDAQISTTIGCVLQRDGTVTCWSSKGLATQPLANVTNVAMRFGHACAVADGALVCQGGNENGQLGRGTRSIAAAPVPIAVPGVAQRVAVGLGHACAVFDGALWCWGFNNHSQAGALPGPTLLTPTMIPTGLSTIDGLDATRLSSCAWGGGAAACWGNDGSGQLGTGAIGGDELPRPVTVTSGIVRIGVGRGHACAQTAIGISCWGHGTTGELGDGTNQDSLTARQVINLPAPITELAVDGSFNCVVANGGLWCWGRNQYGQIGNGTTNDQPAPIQIAVPGTVSRVATSEISACAINTIGDLYCWGFNQTGILGQGDVMNRSTPVKVPLPGPASQVTVGFTGTCAELVDGAVLCWGAGYEGENGTGEPRQELTPRAAPDLADATAFSRGFYGGCAILAGKLSCWGGPMLLANGDESGETPQRPILDCP